MPREEYEVKSDQITLLVFFAVLEKFSPEIRRYRLQKNIYFANIFAEFFDKTFSSHPFVVMKYGPFSKEIYHDVEKLRFWDLIETKKKGKSILYKITEKGHEKVKKALEDSKFESKNDLSFMTLLNLNLFSNSEIKKIVYNELNFREALEEGYRTPINFHYPLVNRFMKITKETIREKYKVELRPEELIFMYLEFLKELSSAK